MYDSAAILPNFPIKGIGHLHQLNMNETIWMCRLYIMLMVSEHIVLNISIDLVYVLRIGLMNLQCLTFTTRYQYFNMRSRFIK